MIDFILCFNGLCTFPVLCSFSIPNTMSGTRGHFRVSHRKLFKSREINLIFSHYVSLLLISDTQRIFRPMQKRTEYIRDDVEMKNIEFGVLF